MTRGGGWDSKSHAQSLPLQALRTRRHSRRAEKGKAQTYHDMTPNCGQDRKGLASEHWRCMGVKEGGTTRGGGSGQKPGEGLRVGCPCTPRSIGSHEPGQWDVGKGGPAHTPRREQKSRLNLEEL